MVIIQGKKYRPIVLEVIESDGRGPRMFRRLHDDETIQVQNEQEFWVVYASANALDAPKPN